MKKMLSNFLSASGAVSGYILVLCFLDAALSGAHVNSL